MPSLKLSKDCTVEGKKLKAGDTATCSNETAKYLRAKGYVKVDKK